MADDIRQPAAVLHAVGTNPLRFWGMSAAERARRIGRAAGLAWAGENAVFEGDGPWLLANSAFVFDAQWLRHIAAHPGMMLTSAGVPVLAACATIEQASRIAAAMRENRAADPAGFETIAIEDAPTLENKALRKRETPFVGRLDAASIPALERASYKGAYKGVTDLLTKYLWPEWAFVLTKIAARLGLTPNMVTGIGVILCIAATILFWQGHFWTGLALGLIFMVLDTVDGKLARCTITSSWWGNIFDHGVDLVHPPFWWFAWGMGLIPAGLALSPALFWGVMAVMFAGYVVQRLIEGVFISLFGMHIHVWRKFDSDFRLVTARRNPNMLILFVSLLFGRPDIGIVAVAAWTIVSLIVHLVQLGQAMAQKARGRPPVSWLSA